MGTIISKFLDYLEEIFDKKKVILAVLISIIIISNLCIVVYFQYMPHYYQYRINIIIFFNVLSLWFVYMVYKKFREKEVEDDNKPRVTEKLTEEKIQYYYNQAEVNSVLQNYIANAEKSIEIISYSGVSWIEYYEEHCRIFAQNNRQGNKYISILLLHPDSASLEKKAKLESTCNNDNIVNEIIKIHKADIIRTLEKLKVLKSQGLPIDKVGLYSDMPFLRGTLIDDNQLNIGFYFFDPRMRGLNNPVFIIFSKSTTENDVEYLLYKTFKNWFAEMIEMCEDGFEYLDNYHKSQKILSGK